MKENQITIIQQIIFQLIILLFKMKIKNAYQDSKINSGKLSLERKILGEREINTFKILLKLIGYTPKINSRFLDLGCADQFLEPSCLLEKWEYVGLDYREVNFEFDLFPIENNSIDFAVSLAVIEHLKEPEIFLNEIFRCLKPGGIIYLSTPNFQYDYKNFYNDPTHVRPYTPISLEQLLILTGFISVSTFPGVRAKNIFWYKGKYRFAKAFYLLPFRADTNWIVPKFLKGHARSVFAIAKKPF
jgi:SAM-dependent methyltransferase